MKTAMNFEELIRRHAEHVFGSKAKASIWLSQARTVSVALPHWKARAIRLGTGQ